MKPSCQLTSAHTLDQMNSVAAKIKERKHARVCETCMIYYSKSELGFIRGIKVLKSNMLGIVLPGNEVKKKNRHSLATQNNMRRCQERKDICLMAWGRVLLGTGDGGQLSPVP